MLTMQVDLDAGTLKFWVDGKSHGPGWTNGVAGRLRWAACVGFNTTGLLEQKASLPLFHCQSRSRGIGCHCSSKGVGTI